VEKGFENRLNYPLESPRARRRKKRARDFFPALISRANR